MLPSIRLIARVLLLALITTWMPSAPVSSPLGDPPVPPTPTSWTVDTRNLPPAPATPQPPAGGALSDSPAPVAPTPLAPEVDPQLPSLAVDVVVDADTIAVGETAALTVTVRNAAPNPARNLVVTLPTPDGASAVAGAGTVGPLKGWSWTAAQLEANSSAVFTGTVRLLRRPTGDALLLTPQAIADGVTVPAHANGGALVTVRGAGTAAFAPGASAALRSADGRVTVQLPARAFARRLALRVRNLPDALAELRASKQAVPPAIANGRRAFGSFVLDAADDQGLDIHKFSQPLTITVGYSPEQLQVLGVPAGDLRIFWFDEAASRWTPLQTQLDADAHTLSAGVDHFSVYTIGDGLSPSTAFLPTLQGFQVSTFTGAASYNYPIQVPAGPGGLTPDVSLSYSSAASDGTSGERAKWQAGWAGKGWSLDPGSVTLNKSVEGANWDNFSLSFGGRSFDIVRGQPLPGYATNDPNFDHWTWYSVDEEFVRVKADWAGDVTAGSGSVAQTYRTYVWHAWSKDGTRYDFGLNNNTLWWTADGDRANREVYKWLLVKVTDTHGNKIVYTYQIDTVSDPVSPLFPPYNPTYALTTISWAYDGALVADQYGSFYRSGTPRYQVWFNNKTAVSRQTGGTAGVDPQWEGASSQWLPVAPHELYRLDTIKVVSMQASAYELVRQYNLGYAPLASSMQTDDYTGNKVLTLTSIERLDQNGAAIYAPGAGSPRPFLTSFTYNIDPGGSTSDTRPAGFNRLATIDNGQGGKLTFTYEHAFVKNSTDIHYAPPTNEWYLYRNIHRVAQTLAQDLSGTNRGALTTYSYQYPTVNDFSHAATVVYAQYPPTGNGDSRDYLARPEKHEFRGHREVIEQHYTWAGGATTPLQEIRHWFYQGDACLPAVSGGQISETDPCFVLMVNAESWKGREYQTDTATVNVAQPLQRTLHTFGRTELPFYGDASSAGYSNHYKRVGLWRAFNYERQTQAQTFEGGSTAITKTTNTFYNLNCTADTFATISVSYGNPRCVQELNGATLVRTSESFYALLDTTASTAASYIVDHLWADDVRDGSNRLLSLTHYFYDGQNTAVSTVGAEGELTRVAKYYDVPLATTAQGVTLHGQDTTYTYDAYGNRATETTYAQPGTRLYNGGSAWSISAPGNGSAARTTTTVYDSIFHVFSISSTNALGQPESAGYDYHMGTLTSVTDLNGNTTNAYYDSFARLVGVVRPGDTTTWPTLQAYYQDTERPFRYRVRQLGLTGQEDYHETQLFYDGLGRKIQEKQEGPGANQNIVLDTRYDGLSRAIDQSQARYSNENGTTFWLYTTPTATLFNHTTTSYDALSRPLDVTAPDGTLNKTRYWMGAQGPATGVYDANNHLTAYQSDALGRRIWAGEYTGTGTAADPYVTTTVTTSAYSPLDLLTSVTDHLGNVTSMAYDTLGRKTSMTDPDMGAWVYTYDINGTLKTQLDAKSQTSSFTYDDLNRLTSRTTPGTWVNYYAYDQAGVPNGIGQRTAMTTTLNGVTQTYKRWEYDTRGRVRLAGQNPAGVTTDLVYTYDSADRLRALTYYEASETVSTNYDAAGRPYSMCGTICYVTKATYTALGQPLQRELIANGLTTSWVYNSPMQRLQDLEIGTIATPTSITHRGYTYDPAGNFQTILDYLYNQTQNFTYDNRDRLTHAGTTGGAGAPGMAYTIDTTYDVLGNMTSKTGVGLYTYGANGNGTGAGPHQARTVNGAAYTYDLNGNLKNGGGWTYNWNADNTLGNMTNGTATEYYSYDADGERVLRGVGSVTTAYFEGIWEQTTTGARTLYYTFNGETVAMRNATGVFFLQGDHLGSVTWAFNSSGATSYGMEYGPWGQVRAGTMATTLNYTGQRLDGTGLLYYHARYYNPVIARFISADTVIPGQSDTAGPANPQNLNRYSYVNNNPIKNTDPTGHCIPGIGDCVFTGSLNWSDGGAFATGVVEGAASVVVSAITAPVSVAQAVLDPAAAVQGLQDQAATVVRGAQFLGSDPSGAAAALNNDPRGVGRVLGQAAGTAALALAGGEGGAASEEGEFGGTCSFSADTLVATERGEQPISLLQIGDRVFAYNQAMGLTGSYTVTAVLVHIDPIVVNLTLDGEGIETTPEHPFFTQERGWVGAGELRIGEHVRRIGGGYGTVQGRQIVSHAQVMYNLTIAVAHTFFVGEDGWLVHNMCASGVRNTPDQDAVIQLAKDAQQRGGLSIDEGRALRQLADDVGVPYRPHVSLDSEVHPGRGIGGSQPHIHVGPVNHLFVK